mgnify:CR=1 FL=1
MRGGAHSSASQPDVSIFEYELVVFAEALLKAGELDQAQQVLEETPRSHHEQLGIVLCSRGRATSPDWACASGIEAATRIAEAEALLLKALETSEQQGALLFKLRAATSPGATLARSIITATVTRTTFSRRSTNGSQKVSILPT